MSASRRILITGASGGIGQAIARDLMQHEFDLMLHCNTNREPAEKLADEAEALGRTAMVIQFDVTERVASREAITSDIDENGAYYGLILNAGTHADAAFPAMTEDQWDSVLKTNLDAFYNVVHPAVMPMVRKRDGGRIIGMSSVSGVIGNRGQVNYSAAKAGLIGAIKALATELASRNITVNCIAPGLIETEMSEAVPEEFIKTNVPARRMGSPEEVAGLVSYLMSDNAAYITRQVISVNGGMI